MTAERRQSALSLLLAALLVIGAAACAPKESATGEEAPATEAATEEAHDEHEAAAAGGAPRVYFVEPQMGATVTSPVKLVFAAENFTIEPRGDGAVHHGAGHHHIGVDTQCLPPGEVIPEAAPWIHFGDGSSEIEVQLTPGEHHIVTQIGDGEHRTLDEPGLCAELHINVVEGEGGAAGETAPTGDTAAAESGSAG
jgi:hypothetical protein